MIAQIVIPVKGLSYDYYGPLIWFVLIYVVFFVLSSALAARGNERGAESLRNVGFGVILVAGAYTLGLLIYALTRRADELWDAIQIIGIVVIFFVLLGVVLLGVELAVGALGRSRADRRRARAIPQPSEDPGG